MAIKILDKSKIIANENGVKMLINEIRAHWALEHCEGILKLLKIYEDSHFLAFILEYQPQGNLLEIIMKEQRLSEIQVRTIMEQCLLAMDFFQKKKIVHRDIKPENILV